MRAGFWATILLTALLAWPASAQTLPGRRVEGHPVPTGATNAADLFREDAAREMDERLARHERAGRRATAGICDGCTGVRRVRGGKTREMVGEDGLPYRADDLR
jgi:hypothetical protein